RRSFTPARTPALRHKDGGSPTSVQPSQALSRGQIPIEIVAPPLLHFPRFRALALFGRRPHEHVVRTSMPASENLHISDLDAPFVSNFSRRHTPTRFPSRDYIADHLESPNRSMSRIASSRDGS